MQLKRAVGKNEKLESFKLESLKLESLKLESFKLKSISLSLIIASSYLHHAVNSCNEFSKNISIGIDMQAAACLVLSMLAINFIHSIQQNASQKYLSWNCNASSCLYHAFNDCNEFYILTLVKCKQKNFQLKFYSKQLLASCCGCLQRILYNRLSRMQAKNIPAGIAMQSAACIMLSMIAMNCTY